MAEISGMLTNVPSAEAENLLIQLAEKSPHENVRAAASWSIIGFYQGLSEYQTVAKEDPTMDVPAFVTEFDTSKFDLETTMEKFVADFGQMKFKGKTYAEIVEPELFVLKNLSVGKVAPEIEGIDLDDKSFKLSDYRGKVVLLDFWGDW